MPILSFTDLSKLWISENSHATILFICIFFTFSFGSLISIWIAKLPVGILKPEMAFALVPMAGIIGTLFIAFPIFLLGEVLGIDPGFKLIVSGISLLTFILAIWITLKNNFPLLKQNTTFFILGTLFIGFLALRFIFIKGLLLPPYSDSVEHYQIIQDFLHPDKPPLAFYKLTRMFIRYYHFGFHSFAAWVATLTNSPVQDTMLVLGQLLQSIIPISLFFPIKAITKNNTAGLLTVLIAGICWRMPGFASNWGKYPALTGLAIFPFPLGVLLMVESAKNRRSRYALTAIAMIGGLITILSHSRTAIMFIAILSSWWIAGRLIQLRSPIKYISIGILIIVNYLTGHQINQNPLLSTVLSPYIRDGFYATLSVFLLTPFSFKLHPRLASAMLLFLLFIFSAALWPTSIPNQSFGIIYLFDRPFAQLIIFIPLSVLGGMGFAGLINYFHQRWDTEPKLTLIRNIPAILLAILTLYSILHSEYTPSSCCQLAGRDDITAYKWMRDNLPESSVILIAGNRTPSRNYGIDGGIWITPLTGFETVMMPNTSVFDSKSTLEELCMQHITHIYTGGTNARFSLEQIYSKKDWYKNIFTNPTVNIYEVIGCLKK